MSRFHGPVADCLIAKQEENAMGKIIDTKENAMKYLERAGLSEKQIDKLKDIGYFSAPASKGHHLAETGGLVKHSINVTRNILTLTDAYAFKWKRPESPYLIGMLHDLVKCKCYAERVDGGYGYVFPGWQGHGEASVMIALFDLKLDLTKEEIVAIRHHMGLWDVPEKVKKDYGEAVAENPQAIIIAHTADWWAAKIDDRGEE